ncbi:MAG: PAS domain-containing protein [Acidobacteriota bacterium]
MPPPPPPPPASVPSENSSDPAAEVLHERPLSALAWCAAHDRWVTAGLVGLACSTLAYLAPGVGEAEAELLATRICPLLFVLFASAAAWRARQGCESSPERRFWTLLSWALLAWASTLAGLLLLAFSAGELAPSSPLLADLGRAVFFGLLLVAAETRPDRRVEGSLRRLEQDLAAPAALFFVGGWLVYLPFLQLRAAASAESRVSSTLFALLLGLVLAIRLLVLRGRASRRWRAVYCALGLALAGSLAGDALALGGALGWWRWSWTAPTSVLGSWPFAFVVLAARVSLQRFAGGHEARPEAPIVRSLSPLLWALSFLFLHAFLHRASILPADGQEARENVMLVMLAGLGGYALLQRRLLVRGSLGLWRQRQLIEEKIKASEQDLRVLLERARGRSEVERSELTFLKAFQASPDGLLLSSWEEGRILQVNDALARGLGYEPEHLIGRQTLFLGWWSDAAARSALLRAVYRLGAVREREMSVTDARGARRRLKMSFERIDLEDETILLTIAHHEGVGFDRSATGRTFRYWGLSEGLRHAVDAVLVKLGGEEAFNRRGARLFEAPAEAEEARAWTFEAESGDVILLSDPRR